MDTCIESILILTSNLGHAKWDRYACKKSDARLIENFTSAKKCMEYLGDRVVDLIICDWYMEDMDCLEFLKIIGKDPRRKMIPVIVVTLENRKNKVLDAISSGCSGYVLRPYSLNTFLQHLEVAKKVERIMEIEEEQLEQAKELVASGNFDDAIDEFEDILSLEENAQHYYDMGYKFLSEQKYSKAIIAFKKAVKINNLFAEAYQGLAQSYQGKGDTDRYKDCLQRAAEIYAQFDRLENTKEMFIEILKLDKKYPNPFNTLGVKLRRNRDYTGAIHAYQQAILLTPDDEHVYYNLAKAYMFIGDYGSAEKQITNALEKNSDFADAAEIYATLTGRQWTITSGTDKGHEESNSVKDEADIEPQSLL